MCHKTFLLISFLISISACSVRGFQPPPPNYKAWIKNGTTEQDIKQAMLDCGYPNPFTTANASGNDEAKWENCMFKKGYKYSSGYKGMCATAINAKDLPACQE
jgi:hypothetical protein